MKHSNVFMTYFQDMPTVSVTSMALGSWLLVTTGPGLITASVPNSSQITTRTKRG